MNQYLIRLHRYNVIIAMLVCFVCGFLDTFTFAFKGFFGLIQTGNLIQTTISLVTGQFTNLLIYFPPIIVFVIFAFFVDFIEHKFNKLNKDPRPFESILILVLLIVAACIPSSFYYGDNGRLVLERLNVLNIISNCIFAMIGSILIRAFTKISDSVFTSTMMTANLNRLVTSTYKGLVEKDEREKYKSLEYLGIILSFCLGAASSYSYYYYYFLNTIDPITIENYLPNLILVVPFTMVIIILTFDLLRIRCLNLKEIKNA